MLSGYRLLQTVIHILEKMVAGGLSNPKRREGRRVELKNIKWESSLLKGEKTEQIVHIKHFSMPQSKMAACNEYK